MTTSGKNEYKFKNEAAIVCYTDNGEMKCISGSLGSFGEVEFNFEDVWGFKKGCVDFHPKNLHFIHVHPPGFCEHSQKDVECLKGFNIAFGYPVLFSIVTFSETEEGMKLKSESELFSDIVIRSFVSYRLMGDDKMEEVDVFFEKLYSIFFCLGWASSIGNRLSRS